jgi:ABC-type proline/glycine betaine transport system permease subunit
MFGQVLWQIEIPGSASDCGAETATVEVIASASLGGLLGGGLGSLLCLGFSVRPDHFISRAIPIALLAPRG